MENQFVGDLAIIALHGTESFANEVNEYIRIFRNEPEGTNYIVDAVCPRFGSGEGKCVIRETVRGKDVFIIIDPFNYGVTYSMYGMDVPYSPDEHYADLKRVIGAIGGKARRLNVIMPMLYEGRQHKRNARESLDCALMLQELNHLGISNFITFDAHDPRVMNAIPISGFENCRSSYQMLKAMIREYPDIQFDSDKMMIVSPDEGGMGKCMYYSSMLGINLGMFYKRRNYTVVVNGKNPIEAHEYLGRSVAGKDVIVVDDMISSGESIIDVGKNLKERGAKRIFVFSTFGLFCNGLDVMDNAFKEGFITRIFTTNLIYQPEALLKREWYASVDMCKFVGYIIDRVNRDATLSSLLDQSLKIHTLIQNHKQKD